MAKCTICGNEVDENAEFCANCGTKVDASTFEQEVESQPVPSQNTKFCANCGETIDINAVICPKCGVKVGGFSEEKSPVLALVLSLIFPGLGQFYNGHAKKGVLIIIAAILSIPLMFLVIGFITYPLVLIYGLYDAYKSAEAINRGIEVPDSISLNYE